MHSRALQFVEHLPTLKNVVRRSANTFAVIALVYIALWIVGANSVDMTKGFGAALAVSFMVSAVILSVYTIRELRKHWPITG